MDLVMIYQFKNHVLQILISDNMKERLIRICLLEFENELSHVQHNYTKYLDQNNLKEWVEHIKQFTSENQMNIYRKIKKVDLLFNNKLNTDLAGENGPGLLLLAAFSGYKIENQHYQIQDKYEIDCRGKMINNGRVSLEIGEIKSHLSYRSLQKAIKQLFTVSVILYRVLTMIDEKKEKNVYMDLIIFYKSKDVDLSILDGPKHPEFYISWKYKKN